MNATAPAATVTLAALTVDCADPAALAHFWGKVLARPVSSGATAQSMTLDATDPASGPRMFFHKVREPKVAKNRLHLDLLTDRHDEEIVRLIGLGARPLEEIKLPEARWTTFADPGGNEFDLLTW